MRPFLVCIHDASPAFARHTRAIIDDLAPLIGRRLSFGVVPDWHGAWPLTSHTEYCRLIDDAAEELLLHGYFHRRQRGRGPVSWLAENSDEMNGRDLMETRRLIEDGQCLLAEVFGRPARGFLAPAWQPGHVCTLDWSVLGIGYTMGFFSLRSSADVRVPLATSTWDCGRWAWLGQIGRTVGWTLRRTDRRVPVLAIHPRDLDRGYWPTIISLIQRLRAAGYEPATPASLVTGTVAASAIVEC